MKAVYKGSELVHIRQFRPWLWPDAIYSRLPSGKEMKKVLGILHGFTNSVIAEKMEEHAFYHHNIQGSASSPLAAPCPVPN